MTRKNFTSHQNIKTKLLQASAFVIAMLIANLFLGNSVSGQTITLAHLGLNNNLNFDIDNAVGTPTASISGLSYGSSSGPCEGSDYVFCDGDNDYLQININTTGFSSITITWQQKWSPVSAPNTGRWNLSGDADNNGTYEYSKTDNADVTASCETISVTLPVSFDNQNAIRLRITSNVTTGNYLLLDDVSIKGTVPCPTITASATKNDVKCFATSTGIITVSGSGGTSPYTFSINNGTTYQASNTFNNLPIGTYQIRVKDANECESKSVQ